MSARRFPAAGPTPVGQRLRASTIPGRRAPGPSVEDWCDDEDEPEALRLFRTGGVLFLDED